MEMCSLSLIYFHRCVKVRFVIYNVSMCMDDRNKSLVPNVKIDFLLSIFNTFHFCLCAFSSAAAAV